MFVTAAVERRRGERLSHGARDRLASVPKACFASTSRCGDPHRAPVRRSAPSWGRSPKRTKKAPPPLRLTKVEHRPCGAAERWLFHAVIVWSAAPAAHTPRAAEMMAIRRAAWSIPPPIGQGNRICLCLEVSRLVCRLLHLPLKRLSYAHISARQAEGPEKCESHQRLALAQPIWRSATLVFLSA
jgi:hypothetical protein